MSTRLGTGLPQSRGPVRVDKRFPFRQFASGSRLRSPGMVGGALGFFNPTRTPATTTFPRGAFSAQTRLGSAAQIRGPVFYNPTRTAIAPTQINLPTGHLTFTPVPLAFSVLQDTVIDLPAAQDRSFTAGATFTIVQSGSTIDLPVAHLTYTPTVGGQGFSVVQTNANDHTIFLPTANLTYTPIPFSVIYENTVELPTTRLPFTEVPAGFDVSITLPGQQTLTQTDILAIWQNINICGFNAQDALCIISAAVAGRLSGADGPHGPGGVQTLEFKSLDGAKTVITAVVDPHGDRVSITLNP